MELFTEILKDRMSVIICSFFYNSFFITEASSVTCVSMEGSITTIDIINHLKFLAKLLLVSYKYIHSRSDRHLIIEAISATIN